MQTAPTYQPRYLAYCREQATAPLVQLAMDRLEYPGASAMPFMLWSSAKLAAFRKLNPAAFTGRATANDALVDHAAYDTWLNALPVKGARVAELVAAYRAAKAA